MSDKRTIILTHPEIERKMQRMAWEIFENNHLASRLIIIGITNNGNHLAKAIGKYFLKYLKLQFNTVALI